MLTRLIWVNVAVFVLLTTCDVLDQFGGGVVSSLLPPEGARMLATSWRLDILSQRPWSVVTHMFAHQGVWHLGMNMLLLFWMGRVYHGEVGSRRLLSTYLAGGLAGFWPTSSSPMASSLCNPTPMPWGRLPLGWPVLGRLPRCVPR